MPGDPHIRIMADILEEHLEELAFLWMQRSEAIHSCDYLPSECAELEERMEAHLQGLLVGKALLMPLTEATLGDGDRYEVFAAAYALLRSADPLAAEQVMDSLGRATGAALEGYRDALIQGPIDQVEEPLKDCLQDGPPEQAVVAAEALAAHGRLPAGSHRLPELMEHENAVVRGGAWRTLMLQDSSGEAQRR